MLTMLRMLWDTDDVRRRSRLGGAGVRGPPGHGGGEGGLGPGDPAGGVLMGEHMGEQVEPGPLSGSITATCRSHAHAH